MLLHVSEENMLCDSGRIWENYVLCFWTYLKRLWSVFLDYEETMFCVSGSI